MHSLRSHTPPDQGIFSAVHAAGKNVIYFLQRVGKLFFLQWDFFDKLTNECSRKI